MCSWEKMLKKANENKALGVLRLWLVLRDVGVFLEGFTRPWAELRRARLKVSGRPFLVCAKWQKHLLDNKNCRISSAVFFISAPTCAEARERLLGLFLILLFLEPFKHIKTTRVVFTCIFSLFPRRLYSELQQLRSLVSVAPARHYCICSLWNTHLTGFMWGNATFSNRLDYLEHFRTGSVFPDVWNTVWKQVHGKRKKGYIKEN